MARNAFPCAREGVISVLKLLCSLIFSFPAIHITIRVTWSRYVLLACSSIRQLAFIAVRVFTDLSTLTENVNSHAKSDISNTALKDSALSHSLSNLA